MKMNQREFEIGARLREFREGIRFSQKSFGEIIGLSRDQIANIEFGRTPLRYIDAWKIRDAFALSVDWLGGGDTPPDQISQDVRLPAPVSPKMARNAILSEVIEDFYQLNSDDFISDVRSKKGRKIKLDPVEIKHRRIMEFWLHSELLGFVACVPDGYTKDLCENLARLAREYIQRLPKDQDEVVYARYNALRWERMRAHVALNLPRGDGWKNNDLTDKADSLTTDGVQPVLPKLIQRLKRATEARGSKSELAARLGVHRQCVTDWLSGKQEPGGEITLRLLHWVEQRERKN
jgi:transcriptional regulator with XRE-family HTH domain